MPIVPLRASWRFLVAIVLALTATPHAQSNWTLAPSLTTANLWGVCNGGGQFVAVGERGTILTSPDGTAWTPRQSGTTAWLTSVAYGLGHYFAVGADLTILVSSDAVSWEPITQFSPNTPRYRLNVVGFDHNQFLAYGEHDFALRISPSRRVDWSSASSSASLNTWWRSFASGLSLTVVTGETGLAVFALGYEYLGTREPTSVPAGTRSLYGIVFDHDTFTAVGEAGVILNSTDAVTWSRQTSGITTDLQALAPFNNTLVAVGAGGTILSTNELGAWVRRTAPTAELLLAVAANDTAAIAVGGSGTILRSTAAPMPPTLAAAPAGVTEMLGGIASFIVRARGSLPLSYQWFRNGAALAGETKSDLIRTPLVATDAGSYTVSVTNSAGTVTSAPATLSLLPAPRAIVDRTFHADDSLDGTPAAVLALADGSVLVANGKPNLLIKLTPAGALDPSWPGNVFGPSENSSLANFSVLALQPDGRLLIGGAFFSHNGQPRSNLIRLNRDGTWDSTFTPAAATTAQSITSLALQSDGKILVTNGGVMPLRLLPNGSLDSSFQPQPLPPVPSAVSPNDLRSWQTRAVSVAPDGTICVALQVSLTITLGFPTVNCTVVRLRPDGALDSTIFTTPTGRGQFVAMRALSDNSTLVLAQETSGNTGLANVRVSRVRRDGSPFPGYLAPLLPPTFFSFINPDGRLLCLPSGQNSPLRFTAFGAPDSNFTGGIGRPTAFAVTDDDRIIVAGEFTLYDGVPSQHVARLAAVPNDAVNAPRLLALTADKITVASGEIITLRAAVVGSGALTYEWTGAPGESQPDFILRTASPILTYAFTKPGNSRYIELVVRNNRGQTAPARLDFTVLPVPPVIIAQPTRISAQSNRTLTLIVVANEASGQNDLEWRRNGLPLATTDVINFGNQLYFSRLTAADAGTYTLTLRNLLGVTVTSAPIVLTIDDSSRFANLSTRAYVGNGEQIAIAGFVVSGTNPRRILIRAIGPGLAQFGVTNPLQDPQLAIFDRAGKALDSFANDDWSSGSTDSGVGFLQRFQEIGAFPLAFGSKDAATIATLAPGSYTVQLSGKPGQSGTGLIEIYEDDNDAARILNLSTRALVTPAAPTIVGLSISGPVAKQVLFRAVGPALASFGLTGALANPRFELKNASGVTVARNDDWETDSDRAALLRAFQSTGAFPFAPGSRDAALLVTLAPGNYTALIESADGTTGVVLAEAYELP